MESDFIKILGTIGFAASCVCGMCCVVISAVNQFRAARHRNLDESYFLCSQLTTVLFSPQRYSEEGLIARTKCIRGLVGFFVSFFVALAIGMLTGVAH